MARLMYVLYNLIAVPLLTLGFFIFSRVNRKARLGYDGRKAQKAMLISTIDQIPGDTIRVLIHCTSVGEYEQAVPVIDLIKKQNPEVYMVVSFFSSSGFNFVKNNKNIDLKIYLPLDAYSKAYELLYALKPSLFIISKFDVWPNFMAAAGKLNISTVMIAATLSSNSKRHKGLAKWLNRYAFQFFDYIFPISDEDKDRFLNIFPHQEKMLVTGDTRFDQVYKKGRKILMEDPIEVFKDTEGPVFIGGSIWPPDEKHLLPVLVNMLHKHTALKAILVPHELHEEHLSSIEEVLKSGNITSDRYTNLPEAVKSEKRVVIVDTIGILAKLYVNTDLAYVGGSFSSGVHNVMEPAVFGQPVIFGPVYINSFEAMELEKIESGFSIRNEHELEELFDVFISNESKRKEVGERAKNLIEKNIGATDKIFEILNQRYGDIKPNPNG